VPVRQPPPEPTQAAYRGLDQQADDRERRTQEAVSVCLTGLDRVRRRTVQTTLRASYTGHYGRGLVALLQVLEFRSNNTAHQPAIDALAWALIRRYSTAGNRTYYPLGESVPTHRGTGGDSAQLIHRFGTRGRERVTRMVYELATFQALREQLRCKEIWVVGADSWRNPEQDVPADFEDHRDEKYRELRKPLDPGVFIADLRGEMTAALEQLDTALPGPGMIEDHRPGRRADHPVQARGGSQPAPGEGRGRAPLGHVALIDVLKETMLRTGCLNQVSAVVGGGALPVEVLAERLMLAIYAYGTNTGIRAGRRRRARPQRGAAVLRPAPLPDPRGRSRGRDRDRERYLRHPAPVPVGWRVDRGCLRLHPLPVLGPEHLHRVAPPLRRPRHLDLLARRARVHGGALPTAEGLGLGSARDGRGRHPARHHHDRGGKLRRLPRPVRDRLRDHPAARVRPVAAHQANQQGPPVPAGRWRAGCVPAADPGVDSPDPVGRPEL